jgi:hypothetical protein
MSAPNDNIRPDQGISPQNSVNNENVQPNTPRREETRTGRRRSDRYYSQFHINQFYDAADDEQYYTEEYVSFIQRYGQFVANSNAMFARIEQGLRNNITRSITREYFYYNRYHILRGQHSTHLPSSEIPTRTPPEHDSPSVREAPAAPAAPAPPGEELPSITRSITTALLDIINRANNTRVSNDDEINHNRRNNNNNHANNNNNHTNNNNNRATGQPRNRDHSNPRQPYAFFFDLTAGLDGNTIVNSLFNERDTNIPTEQQIRSGTVNTIFSRIPPTPQRNTTCAISHEEFTDTSEVTQIRGCSHIFKPSSLARWLRTNSTCPMCRYDIRDYQNVSPPSTTTATAEGVASNPTNIPNRRPDLATITSILTNNNNINDIYNRIIDNSSNFTNAVIENINDDEITFSYDLPSMPHARFNRMIENNENDNNENDNNENDNNYNDLDYNDIEEVD